jgi:hypothetical protein
MSDNVKSLKLYTLVIGLAVGNAALSLAQPERDPRILITNGKLNAEDIVFLLQESRAAANNRSFRVALLPGIGTPDIKYEVQMGPRGWPRYLREADSTGSSFLVYTGAKARACDGEMLEGELVIDYVTEYDVGLNPVDVQPGSRERSIRGLDGARFRIEAHARDSRELLADVFEMYATESNLVDGPRAAMDGHDARALIAPHKLRGDHVSDPVPDPSGVEDWLWIDTGSLFPVRWEVRNGGTSMDYGYVFREDASLDLKPPKFPASLVVPACVK